MARFNALSILMDVKIKKINLNDALSLISNHKEKAFISELCYGICRYYFSLKVIIDVLIEKPLKQKDCDVEIILMMGLYQLKYMSVPDFAAVNETVSLLKKIKKPWAKGLLNGSLRHYIREKDSIEQVCAENELYPYAFPQWLITKVGESYGKSYDKILKASNERTPVVLRVNALKITRDAYYQLLREKSYRVEKIHYLDNALIVHDKIDITQLPFFHEGYFSVQDTGAQFSNRLLDLKKGQRVLDACSAPGGKLCHILESGLAFEEVVALDNKENRLSRVKENLSRLNLSSNVLLGDASKPGSWWQKKSFDRILLDAPCTATGIIRRHPDIKLLRQETDLNTIVIQQQAILRALWPLVKKEGLLLYVTCSLLKEENDLQIKNFISHFQDVELVSFTLPIGEKTHYGWQLIPPHSDGFYYALLKKR